MDSGVAGLELSHAGTSGLKLFCTGFMLEPGYASNGDAGPMGPIGMNELSAAIEAPKSIVAVKSFKVKSPKSWAGW
eukprot:CAMPEP_0114301754 /NCGR_PEP_ID=MMETSP0059-20121206/14285_1 /TAXON_ID=36894 /ORGANISM="Pyramimonas parkeae, Strain CCMP726" /LENGTH=75 /DNA_ID=CAMNT_0001424533 /DNA_START=266 /DNA_END=490 /DNA_ORIENTATION=+